MWAIKVSGQSAWVVMLGDGSWAISADSMRLFKTREHAEPIARYVEETFQVTCVCFETASTS